jgi:hypothetical protein
MQEELFFVRDMQLKLMLDRLAQLKIQQGHENGFTAPQQDNGDLPAE